MARRAAEIADARIQATAKQEAAEARSKKSDTPVRRLDNGLLDVFTVLKRYEKGNQHNAGTGLLSLPPELRNMIWEIVLQCPGRLELWVKPDGTHAAALCQPLTSRSAPSKSLPQYKHVIACRLPRVCRTVYADTTVLVYTRTNFYMYPMRAWSMWIARRLSYQLQSVRSVEFYGGLFLNNFNKGRSVLSILTGLKTLIIGCSELAVSLDISWREKARVYTQEKKDEWTKLLTDREDEGVNVVVLWL